MKESSIDIKNILTRIRNCTISAAHKGWTDLGNWIDSILPDPLDPMVLLPIITGIAAHGEISNLIPGAAAVQLIALALRIVDDYADEDNPSALYQQIGSSRAMNYAMAMNSIATRELLCLPISNDRLTAIINDYFDSFLKVCQGQDFDIKKSIKTLEEYEENVKLKTIKAYEFAAVIGAYISSDDPEETYKCAQCGIHLGWMTQILNDIEALWFPIAETNIKNEKNTFPILLGLKINDPNSQLLAKLCNTQEYDRIQICSLLDAMNVRTHLLHLALDRRDRAIASLNGSLSSQGSELLNILLNWHLRDGTRLLANVDNPIVNAIA